jgi:hypothetical protein
MEPAEDFSEEFFKLVARSVEFGGFGSEDSALRYRVVRLASHGRLAEAITLVRGNSGRSENEARDLIKRIEYAADRAFYATGLRPSLKSAPDAGGNQRWGIDPQ